MTERPIIFSGPMVLALLAGAKTQTRRPLRPQPVVETKDPAWEAAVAGAAIHSMGRCPYGVPGDRLWVRESYWGDATTKAFKWYVSPVFTPDRERDHCRLIPAIHMPRALCRIRLEMTGVRVERLQNISDKDAQAEGADRIRVLVNGDVEFRDVGPAAAFSTRPLVFRALWEAINGRGSWKANPWVWVVEFRRVTT